MTNDPRLAAVFDRTGNPATVAWAHDGKGDLVGLPDPDLAITAAAALGNVAALAGVTSPKPLRKAAAAALHKLRSKGMKVDTPVRHFSLGREEITVPPRAFLSLPDDEGDMQLLLSVTDSEGCCVFATILGGRDLVRESRHAHVSRSELRDIMRRTESLPIHAEISFVAGLHYADLLHGSRHDHGWKHFLEHVAPATLTSARVLDPMMGAPAPRDDEPDPHPWMPNSALLSSRALAAGVAQIAEVVTSDLYPEESARREVMDKVMSETADAALDPEARTRLSTYLDWAIIACRHHGWPRHARGLEEVALQIQSGLGGAQIEAVKASTHLHLARTVVEMAERANRGEIPGEFA